MMNLYSQKAYDQLMNISLSQSSRKLTMLCQGIGLEPHIEFDKNLVTFGPVLPHRSYFQFMFNYDKI